MNLQGETMQGFANCLPRHTALNQLRYHLGKIDRADDRPGDSSSDLFVSRFSVQQNQKGGGIELSKQGTVERREVAR